MNRIGLKKYLMKHLKDYLPSNLQDAEILFEEVAKNNEIKEGIMIRKEGVEAVPILYLDWYDELQPDQACKQIASDYIKYMSEQVNLSVWEILNHYSLEDIKIRLISRKRNEALLCKVPCHKQLDLAFVPYLEINSEMVFKVTYDYCAKKGWEPREVVRAGMENIKKEEVKFMSMKEIFAEMLGEEGIDIPQNEGVYVLTNQSGQFGAAQIGNPEVLRAIEQGLDTPYYILPSSVHEVIILAERSELNPEALQAMVKSVNEDVVDVQEQLSNNVYRYSKEKGLQMYQDGRWFGQGKEVGKDYRGPKL